MAFVVEDGTGVAGSNAYIDIAFANSYHSDRGHNAWKTFATSKRQTAVIRATDYIEKRFNLKFKGHRSDPTGQSLSWPRRDVFDEDDYLLVHSDEIPKELQQATAEYAIRALLISELAPDPPLPTQTQDFSNTTSQSGDITRGPLKKTTVNVGRGAVEQAKEYFTQAEINQFSSRSAFAGGMVNGTNIPEYPGADLLLRRLIDTGNRRTTRGS